MAVELIMLRVYEELPDGFLQAQTQDLQALLGGPALIHLPGRQQRPLFVSMLLHGNEITGLQAVQALLQRYRGRALPRALSLFVGNVDAAVQGMRRLPEQPDYNRIWPPAEHEPAPVAPCPETEMAQAVFARMAERRPFAAVDVHNNNGRNPHYACVNVLSPAWLHLARRFSRQVLYFTLPAGTLAMAFARLAPSVTLECGPVGQASGMRHAASFLQECLELTAIPESAPAPGELDLYCSTARVTVPEAVSIAVGEATAQLHLPADLEAMNWQAQAADSCLARIEGLPGTVLQVSDASGRDCADDYLRRDGDRLLFRRSVTPAMLTTNIRIIRQDCLCYLMEPMPLPV